MTMSLKYSKIVRTNTYQRHVYRLLFSHQNVNKSSSVYPLGNCIKRNEDRSSFSILSKHNCRATLCYPSGSLYKNFTIRNASSDVSTVREFEIYNTSAQYTAENANPSDEVITSIAANQMANSMWNVSDWKIVEHAQNILLKVHEISGLPWWASIVLTAITAKTCITLPFAIISMRNAAKMSSVQVKLDEVAKRVTKEVAYAVSYHQWPESLAKLEHRKRMRKEWKELIEEYNCHPAKSYILILVQLPLWFSFSIAGRNLCNMLPHQDVAAHITFMELSVGGFGWVKNLAMCDPYMILPFAIGFVNIAILEMYNMWRLTPPTTFDKFKLYLFRFASAVIVVAATNMPAAVNVYWLASSSYGIGQAFLMMSPRVRRLLGMPPGPAQLEHPYRHLYSALKSRLRIGAV